LGAAPVEFALRSIAGHTTKAANNRSSICKGNDGNGGFVITG
jgi:hypothetical protein